MAGKSYESKELIEKIQWISYLVVPAPLKVNKKARRKPMSERYTCKKEWNKDDALKALTLENAYNHLIKKVPMLILRFPDPELNKGLIHSYSPAIETVHFQQPSRARYNHERNVFINELLYKKSVLQVLFCPVKARCGHRTSQRTNLSDFFRNW